MPASPRLNGGFLTFSVKLAEPPTKLVDDLPENLLAFAFADPVEIAPKRLDVDKLMYGPERRAP